ncbi:MAG: hypothetical protein RM347_008935 [Nostoc sp. ChiQUE02]|nr:hypothetical protein [Nostoc sp. ChiQUE02]MDZ8232927.1 hypothetical protein [Nostoc sp. ChiQUE02]
MQRESRLNSSASGFFIDKLGLIGVVVSRQVSGRYAIAVVVGIVGQ